MGWCSGTYVFDPVAKAILESDATDASKVTMLKVLIDTLDDRDWDCQDEAAFIGNVLVDEAMKAFHPEIYEEYDEDEDD